VRTHTAPLWEPIYLTYSWVHKAAHILKIEEDFRVEELRREYRYLLSEMSSRREEAGELSARRIAEPGVRAGGQCSLPTARGGSSSSCGR
jgi:hypothetical protein